MNAATGMTFEIRGTKEKFLYGTFPHSTAGVYINGDGAHIRDGARELFWSEYQDYDSPEQLVKVLRDAVLDIARPGPASPVSEVAQVQPNPSLERP